MTDAVVEAEPQQLDRPPLPRAEPCTVVILGVLGDLSRRKLLPALFHLSSEGCLQRGVTIVGVARHPLDEATFRARVRPATADAAWDAFASGLRYVGGDLDDPATYRKLAAALDELERGGASPNHLFHLATPPSVADAIIDGLGVAGLGDERRGWSRVIVEKPFGLDLASAAKLNARLARFFSERQVYRIDHYLGKETVQNALVFRFGNAVFEPVWNRNYVDYVEITAAETLGVEGRGGYYEEAGALRDMVTNHLLELLSLTAMEPPVAFEAETVREAKVQVLRAIHPMSAAEVAERTVRGQYGPGSIAGKSVPGYREEERVAAGSVTETYAAVELHVESWRWAGVPFYLRAGKRLSRALTEIAVHFKRTPQALFARTADDHIEPNVIALRIQPNEGITLTFGAKRPGTEMRTGTVHMDFCYQTTFGTRSPDAYETLLLDAMRGDATLFTRRDMVEAQWQIVQPIVDAWAAGAPPAFPNYAAGSEGPAAADRLLARNGHAWRRLVEIETGCEP
jgi:glucose-6-phosphate 1-dehydrogenase